MSKLGTLSAKRELEILREISKYDTAIASTILGFHESRNGICSSDEFNFIISDLITYGYVEKEDIFIDSNGDMSLKITTAGMDIIQKQ